MTAALATPTLSDPLARSAPGLGRRDLLALLAALSGAAAAWFLPAGLAAEGRIVLAVTAVAIVGWTLSRIPDAAVAALAAIALAAAGVEPEGGIAGAFGEPLILLMLGAFVMAAALTASGLAERLAFAATRPFRSPRGLFYGLALVIAATAFVMPSTSARAALLLPVALALLGRLPDPRLRPAFLLLFPTVILLSAGGSLIGAGAHVLAAAEIATAIGRPVDILLWSALAGPFALVTSLAAVELILRLFTDRRLRSLPLTPLDRAPRPLTGRQRGLILLVAGVVALWVAEPLHGLSAETVALLGALAALPLSGMKGKEAFRRADVELLVFLAATMTLARAMSATGVDLWLAGAALAQVPATLLESAPVALGLAALVAVGFHLAVGSRTARAAVLLPVLVAPLAGAGHDPALLVLVIVLGTGFCQSLPASAKPVATFAAVEQGFATGHLLRLSLLLGPIVAALLVVFGLWIWPTQLGGLG